MFYAGTTDKKTFGGIHVSEDGLHWTLVHKETAKDKKERGAYGFFGFARGSGRIFAVGGGDNISKGGNVRVLASTDGTSWDRPTCRFNNSRAPGCLDYGKGSLVRHSGES